jgi:hypothetical protein
MKSEQRPLAKTPSRKPAVGVAVDRDSVVQPRITLNAAGVPGSLRALPQWVGWRIKSPDKPGGKVGKVPVNPHTGRDASSTDPETWASFDEALAAVERHGLAGVGLVFTKDSGIVGIDLDKCRDAETGALEPWAQGIVETLNSYTEISPTGMGIHVLARGELPPKGRRRGSVEMYDSGRFFTVTGQRFEARSADVELRTDAIGTVHAQWIAQRPREDRKHEPALSSTQASDHAVAHVDMGSRWTPVRPRIATSDEELLAAARRAKNSAKFSALFDEGRIEGYSSASEAESALVALLAFWTGPDAARIDALFRRSKLMRPKWDEARGESTYGAQTIANALAHVKTFFGAESGSRAARAWTANLGEVHITCSLSGHELMVARATLPGGKPLVNKFRLTSESGRRGVAERIHDGCPAVAVDEAAAALEELAAVVIDQRGAAADCADGADGSSPTSSIADRVISLALEAEGVELFHTPGRHDAEAYATITDGARRETHSVKGRAFRYWVIKRYRDQFDQVPSSQGLSDGLAGIAAAAVHDGEAHKVHIRVANLDGAVWIDLGDDDGRAVCVDATGWRVVQGADVPVRFLRRAGMQALPVPTVGGTIHELRPFVNLPDERDWRLFVCVVVTYLLPDGPYVVLVVNGEQGSAKSTLCRVLRQLVDPNKAALRRPPRDERDLMIAANNAWIVAYDNISNLPAFLSDALCTLATGGGFGSRQLFTDDEEKLFEAMRPVVLNGIEDVATRPDLLDRAIVLTLPVIPDEARTEDRDQRAGFEAVRARVLGALLDGVAAALRTRASVKFANKPRMADFAVSAAACASAFGWTQAQVVEAIESNRADANEVAIGNSLIAEAVLRHFEHINQWRGSATDLLRFLEDRQDSADRARTGWPATPRALRGALDRIAPSLRRAGIQVAHTRTGHGRKREILITKVCKPPSAQSAPSAIGPGGPANADDCGRYADGRPQSHGQPSAPYRPQIASDGLENGDLPGPADCADDADGGLQTLEGDDPLNPPSCEMCGGERLTRMGSGEFACLDCDAPENDGSDTTGGAQ